MAHTRLRRFVVSTVAAWLTTTTAWSQQEDTDETAAPIETSSAALDPGQDLSSLAAASTAPSSPGSPDTSAPEAATDNALAFVRPVPKTIAPWIVDVYGRNYDNFSNEGASRVISDWLTNSLIDLGVFNVVNRERIRAVLSERNLTLTGFARDISRDVPENELATAGKVLSVNYILLGNIKNLGANSEVDFKLLDVETTTYSPQFRLNFLTPFNPSIEKIKSVIDRVIGELAASFPLTSSLRGITPDGNLLLAAGRPNGLTVGLRVEIWHRLGSRPAARGVVTRVDYDTAEVEFDQPMAGLSIPDHVARVAITPGAEAMLANGRLKLERGHLAQARDIFAEGIDTYPDHSRLLAFHARTCWKLQDYEAAVISYREALRLEPNDEELLLEAVQALFEAGQFESVVDLLREREAHVRARELEIYLGQSFQAKGYPRQARLAYKRAFRHDPEDPEAHIRLAILAASGGDLAEMNREIRLANQSPEPSLEVSFASAIATQVGQVPEKLSEAIDLWTNKAGAENDFEALASAAELLFHNPEFWRTSLDLAERSAEINPAYLRATILQARALTLGGDVDRAISKLEAALTKDPNNVTLLVLSGELLSKTADYPKAELRLLQAIDLAPEEWLPADALGDHYYRQRQYLKAVSAYQTALRIVEQTEAPDLVSRLMEIGRTAVLGNQHATAQPYLERCVSAAPDNMECRYYLGVCEYESNLPLSDDRAIVNLKASSGFNPNSFYYLGALYDRREEFEAARDWFVRCIDHGCGHAPASQRRVDEIETITGTVIGQSHNMKLMSLDVGKIHGVLPNQLALVISQRKVVGKLKTDEVQERRTVAKVKGGKPRTGYTVRFRPARPKRLVAEKAAKKGVALRWKPNSEIELVSYIVYRREGPTGNWRPRGKLAKKKTSFLDKSAKRGRRYFYRVTALAAHKEESLPSNEVEITP